MNQNLRRITPAVYAAAVLVGFLINSTVGIAVAVGGALMCSAVYTMTRGGTEGATPRRAPRQRNRR